MKLPDFTNFIYFLPTLIIVLLPTVSTLQSQAGNTPSGCMQVPESYLEPERLAILAYQGYLEQQGIPGYISFNTKFASGKITGLKVVQAAVADCLISNSIADKKYIQQVQTQLQLLFQENLGR